MKKYVQWMAVLLTAFTAQAGVFELFDQAPVKGRIRTGAELVRNEGQDGIGALKITGNGNAAQYAYSYDFEVEPGKEYGMSFAYKTSPKFTSMIVMVNFGKDKKSIDPKLTQQFRVPPTKGLWKHKQIVVKAPEGARAGEMVIRLIKVPAAEYAVIDNFRWACLAGESNFFHARKLDTIFDNWTFLGQQHFEHYLLGPDAKVVMEWKKAKAGESFLQINGDGSKMQYPFKIENITVEPQRNYRFSCWIKTNEHFKGGLKIFMFNCEDEKGKQLSQPRRSAWYTKNEWEELVFDFTTPPKAKRLNIWLNLRHLPKDAVICIDQLRFEEGSVGPEMRQSFDPAKKTMTIACPVLGDLAADNVVKTVYTITDKAGKTVKTIPDATGKPLTMSVEEFADGEYRIKAEVILKSGKKMETKPRSYGIYKNPYWKNDLGIIADSAPAPAPWKDLQLDGNTVRTWNCAYEFTPALGIAAITDRAGTQLLKKPVTVTVNGKAVEPAGKIRWTFGKARVAGTVPVKGKGWTGRLSVLADYMGFIRYGLEFDAPASIRQCSVDLALNSVEFLHRADASWSNVGAVDLTVKKEYRTKHRYHEIMFGDIDRGLVWYAPKLYPAGNDFDNYVNEASLAGDFRVNLVNAPLKLDAGKPFKFEFAVASYPFRPAGENWKRLRFRAGKYRNFDMMSSMAAMKYAGMPASRNDAKTDEQIRSLTGKMAGVHCVTLYQIPFYITDFMPEFRYFESEWTGYPARYYNLKSWKDHPNAKMRKCDPRARLWHDLYCWMMRDYLKRFKWDGFYYDCYGSDLYSRHGVSMHPTFEVRSFHERIFLTGKAANPDFFTFTHLGAQQACTSVGFSDVVLMGEQYRAECMAHDYVLDFRTLNQFRYENAVNVGPDRMFLPQYRQVGKVQSPELAAHAIALAYVHNNMLYPSFINTDVIKRCQNRLFGFGLEKAQFFPYWKKNPDGISVSDPAIAASYWKNEKGLFITLLNSVKKPVKASLKLPVKFASAKVFDPVTGEESGLPQDGALEFGAFLPKFVLVTF